MARDGWLDYGWSDGLDGGMAGLALTVYWNVE